MTARAATRPALDRLGLLLLALLAWSALASQVGELALSGPIETAARLIELLGEARYWESIGVTAGAVGMAATIALLGGIGIGVLLGLRRFLAAVAEPLLVGLYSLPKLTLYPMILLIFGLGLEAKVALGALHGLVPVALFTLGGIRGIPPILLASGRVMRLERRAMLTRIVIPAALPEVVTGARIGLALTMLGTLVGEMFASQTGLGFMLKQSMSLADTETILAVVATIFAVALGLDALFTRATARWGGGRHHRRRA